MKVKFIVITKASIKPYDTVGNWADEVAVINDKEDEPCLYIDADPENFPRENIIVSAIPFIIEKDGRRFKIERLKSKVFYEGEILIVDESGREVAGLCRKPSKWNVEYEEFDNLEDAIKRARKIVFGRDEI